MAVRAHWWLGENAGNQRASPRSSMRRGGFETSSQDSRWRRHYSRFLGYADRYALLGVNLATGIVQSLMYRCVSSNCAKWDSRFFEQAKLELHLNSELRPAGVDRYLMSNASTSSYRLRQRALRDRSPGDFPALIDSGAPVRTGPDCVRRDGCKQF